MCLCKKSLYEMFFKAFATLSSASAIDPVNRLSWCKRGEIGKEVID